MSFKKDKRNRIVLYILEKIEAEENGIAKKTSDVFDISLNSVYRYLRKLESENVIKKEGRRYSLMKHVYSFEFRRSDNELQNEDRIYSKYIDEHLKSLAENVRHIWQYSFMEMMNNAIEHSRAESVNVRLIVSCLNTEIIIEDDGIGIFNNIMEYFRLDNIDDALNELFKGKLTTDSANHSGEGIFFTSRIMDRFAAVSSGRIFTHNKFDGSAEDTENLSFLKDRNAGGTLIYMKLSNFSNKKLKDLFDSFSDSEGNFIRTSVSIRNMFDTFPVSRSQAKRLCRSFEKFKEVVLDFNGVEEIGQGFAHQIFTVFHNENPDIKLIPVNTLKDVEKMIRHVSGEG